MQHSKKEDDSDDEDLMIVEEDEDLSEAESLDFIDDENLDKNDTGKCDVPFQK